MAVSVTQVAGAKGMQMHGNGALAELKMFVE